ncbi:spore protease YyaC [Lutispora thermophila]|uniref:Putative sporulation protein YyaC n=1 Tax=Lutispora thermophila DSM 19022 TaxID=1122184 RepID=A0A1M6HYD3_9FIRM|nr:spore protease YyaC [Lutispora thermophila]SHJ27230.1 putative sporulation protein YyaC [Lutispora thermophila DSM 19022]
MSFYEKSVDVSKPFSFIYFSSYFEEIFKIKYNDSYSDTVILCIGTDRSTGDCLGPLVGHKLKDLKLKNVHIFGSLDEPVHAKNLQLYIDKLKLYANPFVIAVDACLGKVDRIGFISIKDGPLSPGAGVNKKLPSVGHISITGIVNVSGFMEIAVLQNTRLSLVMNLANVISGGLRYSLWKYFGSNTSVAADLERKMDNRVNIINSGEP